MNEVAEIGVMFVNGFFTLIGSGFLMLVLLHWLDEIKNERHAKEWREKHNAGG